jgi:hypothetical protein
MQVQIVVDVDAPLYPLRFMQVQIAVEVDAPLYPLSHTHTNLMLLWTSSVPPSLYFATCVSILSHDLRHLQYDGVLLAQCSGEHIL